jgi:surface antigen
MTLKPSKSLLIGLATALFLAAGPVAAQTLMFMRDTPYTHFTKEDHALFDAAMKEALDTSADGASSSWSNPATRASGEFKPVESFERKGLKCRKLYIANKARGRSASAEYNFCKQASGKWAIAN